MWKKKKLNSNFIEYEKLFLALDDICKISFENVMKPELYELQKTYGITKLLKYDPSINELKLIYKKFHIDILSCFSETYIQILLFYFNDLGLLKIIMSKGQLLTTKYLEDLLLKSDARKSNGEFI
jgi:hypothetical protein